MENRSELEERIFHLMELVNTGKIQFSYETKRVVSSLSKVRPLPNGRIDLQTIDSGIRATMGGILKLMDKLNDSHEDADNQNEDI
jgi:hypothetical protein